MWTRHGLAKNGTFPEIGLEGSPSLAQKNHRWNSGSDLIVSTSGLRLVWHRLELGFEATIDIRACRFVQNEFIETTSQRVYGSLWLVCLAEYF